MSTDADDEPMNLAHMRPSPGRPRTNPDAVARPDQVEPIDLHLGSRIRGARSMRAMSRSALAARIGMGVQAIDKYETGRARILASRLHAIARVLDVPITFFYEGFDPRKATQTEQDFELLSRVLSPDNVGLLVQLQSLTRDQQRTVETMIAGLLSANKGQAAGAA